MSFVVFQNRRSFVSGETPDLLAPGQFAINLPDKLLFIGNGSDERLDQFGNPVLPPPPAGEGFYTILLNGYQGVVGPEGPQGESGPQGPTGNTGPAGPIGPQGTPGAGFDYQGAVATAADLPEPSTQAFAYYVEDEETLYVYSSGGVWQDLGPVQGPQGVDGIQGIQGEQGLQGLTGLQGPPGAQGIQGPAGANGAAGAIGPAGPQGPQGPAGVAGPQGVAGADGAQGPAGATGAPGAAGPAGANGTNGATGPQGPQGVQGVTGAQGGVGPGIEFQGQVATPAALPTPSTQGFAYLVQSTDSLWIYDASDTWIDGGSIQGPQGIQGEQGPTGATGAQGPTGAVGPQGVTGAIGPQGPVGPEGPQGPQGLAGPQGATGIQGPVGATGPAGPTGPQGNTGPQGFTGATGATGLTGQGAPVGTITYFAAPTPPEGWVVCDGQSLSRITYSKLFAVIGTNYGSNSPNSFRVPNLLGMFLRGWNPGPGGNDPNRGFGTPQLDDFKSHNHPVSDPGHIHNVTAYAGDLVGNQYTLATTNASVVLTNPLMTIQRSKTNVSTRVVGGTETRPVNVALLPCICAAPTPGVLVENAALPNTLGAVYGIGADTENAVFGHGAGANLITGEASNNVIVGAGAGLGVVDGGGNIAIGAETLGTAGSHADNIAIGALSLNLLEGDSSSQSNIAIGAGAFSNLVTGANNIGLGARAGNFWESGEGNLILGSYTGAAETTAPNNTIVIASGGDATSKLIINEDGALSFSDVYTGASYGAAGQVLQSNGPGARPTWVNAGGFQTYPVSYESNVTTVTSGTYGSTVVRYNLPMVTNPVAPMDATTGKFQPTVAGMWCIQATARCYDDANQESNVSMAKNGNNTIGACGSIGQVFGSVSATVYLNGTTDFVQIIVTTQTGASNSQGGAYFSAFYVGN